ncbi:MAG: glycosyltransferase family 39 protein [Alphaproteobacteria bacterium]|nr:glycosyltransferase family 39 protein [Alphaproteobacteria bacterium]
MERFWSWCLTRPRLVLLALSLAALLPGLATLPPLDRDESRYAQATKQMLETGDFIEIRYQDEARNKKPIGIYWLQAASVSALTSPPYDQIWAYRLPSLGAILLSALLVYAAGRALFTAEAAFIGAGLAALTLIVIGEGHIAKTDAALLACVLAAQSALARAYLARNTAARPWGDVLLFWGGLGLGILIKGPVGPFITGMTVLALIAWERRAAWLSSLRPLAGAVIAALIVLPWAIAIGIATDGAFYRDALLGDFGGKVTGEAERHGGVPGYYLMLTAATLWPGILFLLPTAIAASRARSEPAIRFLIAWAVPVWIIFELVPTKLPHYTMPLYPALTLAIGWALARAFARRDDWRALLSHRVSVVLYTLVGLTLASGPIVLTQLYGTPNLPLDIALTAMLAMAVLGTAAIAWRTRLRDALLCACGTALLIYAVLLQGLVPRLDALQLSPRAASFVKEKGWDGSAPLTVSGYAEPSLVFLLGTQTRLLSGKEAARTLIADHQGTALIADKEAGDFLRTLSEAGFRAEEQGTIAGFNYSRGDPVHLTLYRVLPPPH